MSRVFRRAGLVLGLSFVVFVASALSERARAQGPSVESAELQASDGEAPPTPEQIFEYLRNVSNATPGPIMGDLGTHARVAVPEGLFFADPNGTRKLLEATGNPASRSVLGSVIAPPSAGDWWAFFSFDAVGYVKDDDKDDLDADDLLDQQRELQDQANEMRAQQGLEELEITGWKKPPFYDPRTNNLTWALLVKSKSSGGESVNWEVRLLGREGYMNVQLVCSPDELDRALPMFDELLDGFEYKDGRKYAQYVAGDHVAEYTLGGLVAGGGLLAAAKFGWLTKFWKFLVAGVVAIGAGIKHLFGKLKGTPKANESHKSG